MMEKWSFYCSSDVSLWFCHWLGFFAITKGKHICILKPCTTDVKRRWVTDASCIYALAIGICGNKFRHVILEHLLRIKFMSSQAIATVGVWWWFNIVSGNGLMPSGNNDYLGPCWPISVPLFEVAGPQCVFTVRISLTLQNHTQKALNYIPYISD